MKKTVQRMMVLFAAVLALFVAAVPVHADIAYDPVGDIVYGIGGILLALVVVIFAVSLIAGIVLLIIFSVRRKKRRAAGESKDDKVS